MCLLESQVRPVIITSKEDLSKASCAEKNLSNFAEGGKFTHLKELTRVELFDDEFYLSVHVWLVFLDETLQDLLHALYTQLLLLERIPPPFMA